MPEDRGSSTARAPRAGTRKRCRVLLIPALAVLALTAGGTAVGGALPGTITGVSESAEATPDPHCTGREPELDHGYWWRCVAAWSGEPIERDGADFVASYELGKPGDVVGFRYTPLGRAQLLALGLSVQNATPGLQCGASSAVCEIPVGTPLAPPGTYVTQAEYTTPRGTRTVDWFVEIVARP